jgi:hypothetical protein
MNTKTTLVIVAAVALLAVALAPLATSVHAAKQTTCTNGGGQTKECGTAPAKCETVKAGQGQGSGEIKSSTDFASC